MDQFIRVEAGKGSAVPGGREHPLEDGSAVMIPAGTAADEYERAHHHK